ncbi:hypothetical protein MBLNU459_g6394t1 [Dothideomycetes sp. NU459]
MIEWRDRGYVLDSDEEELTLSDGDTPPAKDTTHGKDSSEAGDREADKAEREFGALQDALSGPPPATGALALTSAEEPLPQRTSQTSATDVYDPDADIGKTCLELTDNGGQDAAHNGTAVRDTAQIETPGPHDSSGDSIYFIDAASTQRPSRPLRTYGRRGQPTVLQPSNNRAPDLPPAAQNYDPASSPLDLTTQPSQTSTIDSISGLPSHASHKTTDTTGQDPARDILDQRRASVSSSDLSDVDMDILSSSPGRLFFRTASSGEPATTSTTPGVEAQRLSFSPEAVPVAEQQYGLQQAMLNRHLTSLAAPLRTLRARKAIQLHPYMVESERYRNTLRARGIRPVQVATNSQNPRQGAEDTQDLGFRSQDTQSQSQSQSHTLTSTPPDSSGASQSQAAVPSLQHAMSLDQFVDAGDEFPDLDTLLQRHVAGGVQQGHKRRKTIDTPDSRDRSRHFPSSTSGTRGKLKYIKSRPYGSLNALINGMPPSPPTTSSPSNLDPLSAMMPRFRVPRGATPTLTETPVALSPYKRTEVSSVRRPHLVEPLSSASDDDQGDDESENSSPWSSDADERQLRRMQKRIKGVLPASWLKLDRKGQRKPLPLAPNGVQYEPSPQQPAPLKGVAQRRIPSASSTPAPRRHTLIISDESDESDNSRRALQMSKVIRTQHRQPEQRLLKPFDDDFDDEVVEHDEIDVRNLTASGPRTHSHRQVQRTYQPRKVQVKPRGMLERHNQLRPAQLEGVATHSRNDYDMLTFAPPPSRLMEIFNRDRVAKPAELRLERFLQDRGDCPVDHGHAGRSEGHHSPAEELPDSNGRPPIKRRLKQRARRFDVQLATYRQPSEPLPTEITFNTLNDNLVEENAKLLGLGPLGTRYPTDFDIRPLEIGTYFHQSTFIGSGDFQDSLNLRDRDLDAIAGRITIDVQGKSLEWSAWDEEVSAGLTTILSTCTTAFRALSSAINQQDREVMFMESATLLRYHLRSLVRYCSGCLYFFDPVDRSPCVARISRFLNEFTEMLDDRIPELRQHSLPSSEVDNLAVDSFLYLLVMSSQALKIAQHSSVESTVREALVDKIRRLSRKAIDLAFPGIFSTLRSFYERQTQHVIRDAGIRDDETAAKTVVMVNQILKVRWIGTSLSDILADRQRHTVNKSCNVQNFDQVWYDVFTIQPLLEIDAHGIFRPGSRFQTSNDNWDLIKCLLHRLFQLYPASSQPTNASVNDYVRACLARGYVLMARWGWHMCETLLSTVYDFFARNNLAQLPKEEGRGSVQFLNELDKDPTVQVDTGDCAFHIFLKSLVVGLQGMQNIYPERKVRGFAWRFIPNHGRTYRKDQDITQTSLDALRNHHDLLCTLYWVLPAGSGPRLEMIKDLVNHTTSHREACQISVHAWGMIAKYQMSREQEFKDLHSLGDWFKEMVTSTISQYRLARSEAETQYASEMAKGTSDLSQEVLDTTIASNQRSIVGTLLDLLQVLQQAVRVAKNPETVCKLVNLSGSVEVFKLFDPDQTRLLAAVTNSLDIFKEMFDVISRTSLSQRTDSQQGSEESQDYGEWEHLDEAIDHVETPRAASVPLPTSFLYEPLAALLSSCFGAEKSPNDDVLTKVIDVWVEMARRSVKSGVQDWSAYLDTYSTASWFQLRKTEQKRKLTPYFLSSVVEADPTSLNNHRSLFLGAWLVSLLDRESMLKYQHKLTMSLLNNSVSDPLLHNLPFASNPRTGLFSITLADFRSRRLSLLGTIFSNMRRPVESSAPGLVSETRRAYNTMLRQAQSSMRETYQELQTVSANAQSSYVAFVQAVVSLLQQHTLDICAIDPFFVDSSAFPLPANDPAYVVGRLKSYVSKLEDARARKQLAVFVQTVGERAAVDGLQGYLVSQLHDALGGAGSKLLRQVLLTAILPAYVEASTTTSSGWILAVPLVKAAGLVLADLVYEVDPADHTALQLHVSSIRAVLAVLLQLLQRLADDAADAGIAQPHHLRLLAAAFDTAKASLTTVDWIRQSTELGEQTAAIIRGFVTLGEWFWDVLVVAAPPPSFPEAQEDDDADARDAIEHTAAARPALAANGVVDLANPAATATTLPYRDTLAFSRKNLLDDLNRCWVRKTDTNTNGSRNRNDDDEGEDDDDDDEGEGSRDAYYVSRGGSVAREVVVDIGLAEEERARARTAIRGFMVGYDVVFRRRGVLRDGGCG